MSFGRRWRQSKTKPTRYGKTPTVAKTVGRMERVTYGLNRCDSVLGPSTKRARPAKGGAQSYERRKIRK